MRVPEPRPGHPPHGKPSAGFSFWRKDKPLSGTRLTARTLVVGRGTGGGKEPYGCCGDRIWRPRFGSSVPALLGIGLYGRPYNAKGGAPMSTIATAARTADRIDYWIRRHVIVSCYGTHPPSK
jgi:hypothetical protein